MSITSAKFKSGCLKLMDNVAATREPITITKRGKPVAQLVPIPYADPPPIFGCMRETVLHQTSDEAIWSTGEAWDGDR